MITATVSASEYLDHGPGRAHDVNRTASLEAVVSELEDCRSIVARTALGDTCSRISRLSVRCSATWRYKRSRYRATSTVTAITSTRLSVRTSARRLR